MQGSPRTLHSQMELSTTQCSKVENENRTKIATMTRRIGSATASACRTVWDIFFVFSLVVLDNENHMAHTAAAKTVMANTDKIFKGQCNSPNLERHGGIQGANQYCIDHDGLTRCWYLYVPPTLRNETVPIVLDPHGYDLCATEQAEFSGWDKTADAYEFLLVWPQGNLDAAFSNDPSWDFGLCCSGLGPIVNETGFPPPADIDDIGFMLQVMSNVRELVRDEYALTVDTQRIYLAGHSNGCMLSQAMAALTHVPAAVCCVASSLFPPAADTYQPTPVQVVYGSLDFTIGAIFQSDDHILETWGPLNECSGTVPLTEEDESGLYATHFLPNCTAATETVEVYQVGHFAYYGLAPTDLYPEAITSAVNTTEISYEFCRAYTNPNPPVLPDPVPYVEPDEYFAEDHISTNDEDDSPSAASATALGSRLQMAALSFIISCFL